MLFRRGKIWWYQIKFGGRRYRESTKTTNQRLAERAERKRVTFQFSADLPITLHAHRN